MRLSSLFGNRSLLPARDSFGAHVLSLMTSSLLAQGLGIVTAPILTRLYSPSDFGIVAAFLSLSNIIAVVASWRYEIAIMLPDQEDEARDLALLAIMIVMGMSILSLIMVALFRQHIANLLKTPELAQWLWLAPVNIFMIGSHNVYNYWTARHKRFSSLAMSRLASAVAGAGVQIGSGTFFRAGPAGLIFGQVTLWATATGVLIQQSSRQGKAVFKNFCLKNLLLRGKEYFRFPLLDSWAILANFGAHKLPILIITYFFGSIAAGYYFLGYRVLYWPLGFISESVAQVFFQRYEENKYSDQRAFFLWKIIKNLGALAIIPSVLLFFFAPFVFKIGFGDEWVIAGEYIQYLSPVLFFRFIVSPLTSVLWSEQKNLWNLQWQTLLLASAIVSFCIGGYFNNIKIGLLILSISQSFLYGILIVIIMSLASRNRQKI